MLQTSESVMNTKSDKDSGSYFVKRIFKRFFIPSIISAFGLSLGSIAEAMVVGNKLSETGLSAIGFSTPIFMINNIFAVGLGIGGSIHYVKNVSKGRTKDGVRLFNRICIMALLISIIMGVLGTLFLPGILIILGTSPAYGEVYVMTKTYLRVMFLFLPVIFFNPLLFYFVKSDDNPKLATAGLVIGNMVDILLNILFVIIFDWGIKGAIYATVIGTVVSVALYLLHFILRVNILRFQFCGFFDKEVLISFGTGLVSSLQYVYEFVYLILLNHLLMRIGGELGVAVFNVVINISYVVLSIAEGTGGTIQPMAGTFYSENNFQSTKDTLKLSLQRGLTIALLLISAVFAAAGPVSRFFGLNRPSSAELGTHAIRIYCIGAVFASINIIFSYFYQSVNKEKIAFFINILRSFILFLAFSILFSFYGINNFWWTYAATEAVTILCWGAYCLKHGNSLWSENKKQNNTFSTVMDNQHFDLSETIEKIEVFLGEQDADMKQTYYVNMAIEEICSAIIQNAFKNRGQEYIQLTVVKDENHDFTLYLRDSAAHFNPFSMKTKKIRRDDEEGLDAVGILLVKKQAKEFNYRRYAGFNTLMIRV